MDAVGKATQRKDGRWQTRVGQGAKRKYLYGRTRAEALEKARQYARAVEQAPALSRERLGAYLDGWLPQTSVRAVTRQSYARMLATHVVPALGEKPLAALTPMDVQRWVNGMTVGPRTVQYAHGVLRKALNDAMALELISRNPAARTTMPRQERKPVRVLSKEEAKRLLAVSGRYKGAYALALGCGLRLSEVLGVRGEDVQNGVLAVTRTLTTVNGALVFGEPKTKRSRRLVPVPGYVLALLPSNGLVFQTKTNNPISPRNLLRAFYLDCAKAGLKTNFHALRHSYVTFLLDGGTPVHVVSRLAGHASISTTVDIYGHISTDNVDVSALDLD